MFFAAVSALVVMASLAGFGAAIAFGKESNTPHVSAPDPWDSVRALILGKMQKDGLPSVAVAVARNGKIVWEEAWGWANIEKKIKATPRTMYSLASASKPVTATGLMVLAERRLVDLDKAANDYLGTGKLTGYAGDAAQATVKRVLQHVAGLPTYVNVIFANGSYKRPEMEGTIRRYGILVTPPGEIFNYSNLGYGIIDHIISRVSQRNFPDFMKSEVFEPLGMTRSAVFTGPGPEEMVAQRYTQKENLLPFLDFDHRGASAVYASAHDMVRFGMFHLKNHLSDQKPILGARTIDAMQQASGVKILDAEAGLSGYGLGWPIIDLAGYRLISHSGGTFGVGARLTLIPRDNIACVILTNAASTAEGYDLWDIERAIFSALIQGFPEAPVVQTPADVPLVIPDALGGMWKGVIKADGRDLPVTMVIDKAGKVRLEIDGQVMFPVPVKNPLGNLTYKDGVLRGPFLGSLKTVDTASSPHIVLLNVKLRGEKLNGSASAVAMDGRFWLPFWIDLDREPACRCSADL
jgi:CubicO group peptidase (beta-lactamase class C family)